MNEVLNEIEIKNLTADYQKCDYYLDNLTKGNISYLNEAINYSSNKYQEYLIKETFIAFINSDLKPSNLDVVSNTIKNLNALKKMISEMIMKKVESKK